MAILACEGWDAPTRVSPMPAARDGARPRRWRWPGPGRWALALVSLILVVGLGVGWLQGWTPAPRALEANDPASAVQTKPAAAETALAPAPALATDPAAAQTTQAPEAGVPPSAAPGADLPPVNADKWARPQE